MHCVGISNCLENALSMIVRPSKSFKFYLSEIHFFKNCVADFISNKMRFLKRFRTYAVLIGRDTRQITWFCLQFIATLTSENIITNRPLSLHDFTPPHPPPPPPFPFTVNFWCNWPNWTKGLFDSGISQFFDSVHCIKNERWGWLAGVHSSISCSVKVCTFLRQRPPAT